MVITIYGIYIGGARITELLWRVFHMRGIIAHDMFECVPEIDFNSGYKYFLGNMDNYKKALLSILKSVKSKIPILHQMLRSEEYEGLRMITQTLRRMMTNVGAHGISERSYELEVSLLNQEDDMVQDKLREYIICLSEFSNNMESLFQYLDVKQTDKVDSNITNIGNYDFTKTKESIKLTTNLLERKII